MLRDRWHPMELVALVPALSLAMEPVLAQLHQWLDEDVLVQWGKADPCHWGPTPPSVRAPQPPWG
jgi:hypothetical protein